MDVSKTIEKINARISGIADQLDGKVAKVGWFPSAQYEDGTPVAYVAAIQEYGSPERGIPARAFARPTISERSPAWKHLLADGARAVVQGEISADDMLEGVGMQAAGDIQKTIAQTATPPLSPVTVLLRKWRREGRVITGKTVGEAAAAIAHGESIAGINADPLRDTGLMIATLTNTVGKPE